MMEQLTEYKKCPTCGKLYFPSHGNQAYCSSKCCSSSNKPIPKTQKICPICGESFLGQNSKKYCSRKCCQKEQYARQKRKIEKKQRFFILKNPIGVIENVTISYIIHEIWFVQDKGKMGNIALKTIRERNFQVSDILSHNGFKIENPSLFDQTFKELMKKNDFSKSQIHQ